MQKQKQYFVKYKGLAHGHNNWIPESQLLLEAPSLVAKFNRKNQVKYFALYSFSGLVLGFEVKHLILLDHKS